MAVSPFVESVGMTGQSDMHGNGYVTLTPDPLSDIAGAVKDRQPHLLL